MPFQRIPARRLQIRQKCLINDQAIVEVDVSANHPTMIFMLLGKPEKSFGFYEAIAADSGVCREAVKDFIVRFIGAASLNTGRVKSAKSGDKAKVVESIGKLYPDFAEQCFKGIGKSLQALDEDVMLRALTTLLDKGVVGLALHDAIVVNEDHSGITKKALELAWVNTFQSKLLPKISTK